MFNAFKITSNDTRATSTVFTSLRRISNLYFRTFHWFPGWRKQIWESNYIKHYYLPNASIKLRLNTHKILPKTWQNAWPIWRGFQIDKLVIYQQKSWSMYNHYYIQICQWQLSLLPENKIFPFHMTNMGQKAISFVGPSL